MHLCKPNKIRTRMPMKKNIYREYKDNLLKLFQIGLRHKYSTNVLWNDNCIIFVSQY